MRHTVLLVVVLLMIGMAEVSLNATQIEGPDARASDAYDYPIKPGTPAWAKLSSHGEMERATRVPYPLLSRMSTDGLVDTVLNYPLLGDILFYDDIQTGFDRVASSFSGLQELMRREDGGRKLLLHYRSIDPSAVTSNWPSIEKGRFAANLRLVEILLSQEPFISSLSQEERRDMVSSALAKQAEKSKQREVFGHSAQETTALLLARVLFKEKGVLISSESINPSLRAFIERGRLADDQLIDEIVNQATLFLAE